MLTIAIGYGAECEDDVESCTPKQLCKIVTKSVNNDLVWNNSSDVASHLSLAKELGLNCGDVKDICDLDPQQCKLNQICDRATIQDDGELNWNFENLGHVVLAKEYGLGCKVGEVSDETNQAEIVFTKKQFNQLDKTKRKQAQYGLAQLGYYNGAVDGVWGSGTDKAIQSYVTDRNIKSDFPNSLIGALASEVELGSFRSHSSAEKKDKLYKAKTICKLENLEVFNRLVNATQYTEATEKEFKALLELTREKDVLRHSHRKIQNTDGKWTWFFPVKCARNNNNWSTCGHPNAKVKLRIDKSEKLMGEVFVPWEYNTTGPPITKLQYTCK